MPIPDVKIIISGVDKFSSTIGKSMKGLSAIGRKTAQIGKSLTRNLTLPIVAAATLMTVSSIRINEAMASVGTLIPGNVKRLEQMKIGVQELALATGKAQEDIAEGLFQTISAFGDQADAMEKLRIAARAGVAGRATTLESLDLLSAVTKAYGDITAKTTQKVADLAFKTNELGQTTFPEMAASMGKVAPFASILGVKMEEMFGVFATGTGVTGRTAEVSTQFAGALGALLKPNTDMVIAFKKLGVETGKELIQQRGLQGSFKALEELTSRYDITLGQLLGRKEALNLVLTLNNKSAGEFTRKLAAMGMVAGATDKAFKEQAEGINKLGFAFNQLKVRTSIVLAQFGDRLAPTLLKLVDKQLVPLLEKISNLNEEQVAWIFKIGAVALALGPLLVVIGSLIGALVNVVKFGRFAWTGIRFLAIGLTKLTPITALISAAFLIWANNIRMIIRDWDDLVFIFQFWWKKIVVGFENMVGKIIKVFEPLVELLDNKIVKSLTSIGGKVIRILLPQGLEQQFGLTPQAALAGGAGRAGEALRSVVDVNSRNEFAGKLIIEGAPARSRVEVTEGNIEIETDTGLLTAGATR